MRKSLLILSALLLSSFGYQLKAQRVTNVRFHQAGDSIVVQYSLFDVPKGKASLVDLYVSTDGGTTYIGPLKEVSGDVGHYITEGQRKVIYWRVMDEMPTFGGNVVFDIRALVDQAPAPPTATRTVEEKAPKEKKDKSYEKDGDFLLTYTASTMSPIGLTLGKIGGIGFYATFATNYAIGNAASYEVSSSNNYLIADFDEPGYYEYTGEYAYKRTHFGVGPIFQVAKHINLYVGLRYSVENVIYEYQVLDYDTYNTVLEESSWAMDSDLSNSWVGAEGGIMFQFGAFVLGAGVSAPTFTATFNIGFGF